MFPNPLHSTLVQEPLSLSALRLVWLLPTTIQAFLLVRFLSRVDGTYSFHTVLVHCSRRSSTCYCESSTAWLNRFKHQGVSIRPRPKGPSYPESFCTLVLLFVGKIAAMYFCFRVFCFEKYKTTITFFLTSSILVEPGLYFLSFCEVWCVCWWPTSIQNIHPCVLCLY